MRKRVRTLVDERTRMLVAVSHDLRTPLTRLRLRVERLRDDPAKAAMLDEIATVNEMLTETLAYMREAGQNEPRAPTTCRRSCRRFPPNSPTPATMSRIAARIGWCSPAGRMR